MSTLLGDARIRIRPDTKGFEGEAKSSIGSTMVRVGKVAAVAFAGAATAAGGFGLKIAADMEQAKISFETMLGSGKKAEAFLTDLKNFAAKTPFEFPELQTAASSLISVGVDAAKVIPIMTNLGNATSGMGTGSEGVKRATVALQQMSAAGKITGGDLNQLRDAGIPVFDLLAAATGKSKEEVAGLAQAGKLGKKELEQLMGALESGAGLEKFTGLMDKQSQSLSGLVSTAKDAFGMGLANAMQPLIPTIKVGLEKVTPLVSGALAGVSEKIGVGIAALPGLWQKVGPALTPIKELFFSLVEVAKDLGPLVGAVFGGGAMALLKTFGPMLQSVTKWLAENKEVTMLLAGAWVAVSVAMNASPIGLVITALGALAVGLKYAWDNSATFREVVTTTWTKVQEGALWMWDKVLKPTFEALKVAWAVVSEGVAFYWSNVLKPVFEAWWTVVSTLWGNVLMPIFGLIGSVWSALATGIGWYWSNVLKPVFDAWWSVVSFLWKNVLQPIFGAIGSAWSVMAGGIKAVWNDILTPVFTTFKSIIGGVQTAFETAVSGIGSAWDGLKSLVAKPIKWVIDTVWNNGLLAAWNWVNNLWGGEDVKKFDTSKLDFARGGIMPGYTPGRDVHRFVSPTGGILNLSGGEAIMRPEVTRALGVEGVEALNSAARSGGAKAVQSLLGERESNFAGGGVWELPGWVKPLIPDSIEKVLEGIANNPMLSRVSDMVTGTASKVWDAIKSKVGTDWQGIAEGNKPNLGTMGDGLAMPVQGNLGASWAGIWSAVKAAIPQARNNSAYRNTPDRHGMGKAIDFGFGTGPGGAGSAGLALINRFLHDNYKSQLYELIYDGLGDDRPDLKKGSPLTYNAATRAAHRNHVHAAVYDSGGVLEPGLTVAGNSSGRREAVLTADQWDVLRAAAQNSGAVVENLTLQVVPGREREGVDEMMHALRRIKRGGVLV